MASTSLRAVCVGAGQRGLVYASYAQKHPDQLRIVAVVEPDDERRQYFARLYDLPQERVFRTVDELVAGPRLADAAFNATMDQQHLPTSIPLLEAGYHLLLEKPLGVSEAEMWQLVDTAKRCRRHVMICHVLRYAPFYTRIREIIAQGELGEIMNVQTTEHVSYHHFAVAYVRGKWSNTDVSGSTLLMAKSSHDLDLIAWMKSGIAPTSVSSFGGRMFFRAEKAPRNAGTRCVVDCPVERECDFSARKHYVERPNRWSFYVWDETQQGGIKLTDAEKIRALETSTFGRCVWKHDNDIVDHQSVVIGFADGSTAVHNLVGGAAQTGRTIHITGTKGEIVGRLTDNSFVVRNIDPLAPNGEYHERVVDVNVEDRKYGGHAGGDLRLVEDFVRTLLGGEPSISCTSLDDSIAGHLIGFRADTSMAKGAVESLTDRTGA